MKSTNLNESEKIFLGGMNLCKPVKSDDQNWFSTGDLMFENETEDWKPGDAFLIPIVRLTDERVKEGFSRRDHCDSSIVEKYIGIGTPANLQIFVTGDTAAIVEGQEILNVDEWAEFSSQKINLGFSEIKHNPTTHNNTLENSLVVRIKTKSTIVLNGEYTTQVGFSNSAKQEAKIVITLHK